MAPRKNQVRVDSCLICDEVRREDTGKDLLIGVYGADILVPAFPVAFMLSAYLELASDKPAIEPFRLRGLFDGREVFGLDGQLEIKKGMEPVVFAVPKFPVKVAAQGELVLKVAIGRDAPWRTIKRKAIRQGTPAQPSASAS